MIGWLLLLALPCAAADLFLTPSSFVLSPGERFTVTMEGGPWTTAQIKDPILVAATGVYNLTNLRAVDGAVMVDGTAKSKGGMIAAAHGALHGQQHFAKVLLTCDATGDTVRKVVGHALEIVPEGAPRKDGFSVLVLMRGKPTAGVAVELNQAGGSGRTLGTTGKDGRFAVKPGDPGVYRIVAAPGPDQERMRASFVFELK